MYIIYVEHLFVNWNVHSITKDKVTDQYYVDWSISRVKRPRSGAGSWM